MTYEEIEMLLWKRDHRSTVETLRTAILEEAAALGEVPRLQRNLPSRMEDARAFYAEDISAWLASGEDIRADSVLAVRERYAKSWAFAQVINKLLTPVENEVDNLKSALKQSAENLSWMADTIHQANHNKAETWKECSMGVCGSMEHMLAQVGFDKDLKPVRTRP